MSQSETYVSSATFFLAAEHFPAAVSALHQEAETDPDGIFVAAGDILAIPADCEPKEAIRRCFDACGWELQFDQSGNITDLWLTYEGSLYGDANFDSLFYSVAPYVREGSYISLVSTHGAAYAYHFRGGKCLSNALVDPIGQDRVPLKRDLVERIRAYLLASDVEGSGTGTALADEIARTLRGFHLD